MKKSFFILLSLPAFAGAGENAWNTQRLLSDFHAEGAGVGDIDGDGHADIAYGPFWFAGPDFATSARFAEGASFDGSKGYSDNFFSYVLDATGDGHADVLVYGFPGKEARLRAVEDTLAIHRLKAACRGSPSR